MKKKNKENKKKGINTVSFIISILNSSNKQLSDQDLENIIGGNNACDGRYTTLV